MESATKLAKRHSAPGGCSTPDAHPNGNAVTHRADGQG